MKEEKYIKNKQKIVVGSSAIILMLIAYLWIQSSFSTEWKNHQDDYIRLMKEINDSLQAGDELLPEKGIYEIELNHLSRTDRCITCHIGMENILMQNAPQPHTMHPGTFLEDHPSADFGCTICHAGQGRALNKKDAFGIEPETHWPEPMLYQPYIQSSCGKCHLTVFDQMKKYEGTDVFQHGHEIFSREGCLGCHKARGVGGIIGPDLTEQGEKTRHEYDFQNITGEESVSNWLKEHFMDPEMVSPGSQMLKIDIPEEELGALATFVMGLAKPDMPVDYFSVEMLNELKGIRSMLKGSEVYSYTCSSCHGKEGSGKDYENYETGVPAIMNIDFLRVASNDFIRFTLMKGRSQRQMAAWSPEISGFFEEEIFRVIDSLNRSYQGIESPTPIIYRSGDTDNGSLIYNKNCSTCHGDNGNGGLAVAINQEDFLNRASDIFIIRTIREGRNNTAMPAWPTLSTEELSDLLSYVRKWHNGPVTSVPFTFPEGDPDKGKISYHYNCSRCHGVNGEGETGPAIINRSFLEAASDYYLYKTVSEGRNHTSMFGWSKDVFNAERLNINDIADIFAFMKLTSQQAPDYLYSGSNPGNTANGIKLYQKNCSECHGEKGEGTIAPALNNQEFLSGATNGYLLATITIGRKNTKMPAWGYENNDYGILSPRERQDITAYIRSWQRIIIKF